jgi:hypothetical protein
MKVDINEVRAALKERQRINGIPLELLELYEGDRKIDIEQKKIDEFKFFGLNNIDFIRIYFLDEKP